MTFTEDRCTTRYLRYGLDPELQFAGEIFLLRSKRQMRDTVELRKREALERHSHLPPPSLPIPSRSFDLERGRRYPVCGAAPSQESGMLSGRGGGLVVRLAGN